jgi:prepilin-type N-terminal cleavage/methylation domain-containing protein
MKWISRAGHRKGETRTQMPQVRTTVFREIDETTRRDWFSSVAGSVLKWPERDRHSDFMYMIYSAKSRVRNSKRAFTLIEVVTAIALAALVFGSILVAYTQAAKRAQWSGLSLAAEAYAMQSIEQARSAIYDPAQSPVVNEILLLAGTTSGKLDIPISKTNIVYVTNTVTITMLTNAANTQVNYQMVRVQTVWPFRWGSTTRYYTNVICTYCAPDNRANSTF